jgi:hypothetical protein
MVWAVLCAVVFAPLCLLGFVEGSVWGILCCGLAAAAVAVAVDGAHRWWCELGVGAIAVAGAVAAVGGLAVPLVVLALLTSPPACRRLGKALASGRRARRDGPPVRATGAAAPGASGGPVTPPMSAESFASLVAALDDGELAQAWVRSWWALGRADDLGTRMQLVQLRQAYLDEMERRVPRHFRQWIDGSARADGDPARHLFLGGQERDEAA